MDGPKGFDLSSAVWRASGWQEVAAAAQEAARCLGSPKACLKILTSPFSSTSLDCNLSLCGAIDQLLSSVGGWAQGVRPVIRGWPASGWQAVADLRKKLENLSGFSKGLPTAVQFHPSLAAALKHCSGKCSQSCCH
jgi:hypothetical protein